MSAWHDSGRGTGNGFFLPDEEPDAGTRPGGVENGPAIETDTMRITVRTQYADHESDPQRWRYVFVYHIRIQNLGDEAAQLFWRHWRIHDPIAGDHEVQGEGVVGETPWLDPGTLHEYNSFCVLRGPMGHMDGFYHFRRRDGSVFRAPIPRFYFQAPPGTGSFLA